MQIWQDMKDVIAAPFGGELDLMHLFLLIGVILVFVVAWMFILAHIRSAAMELVE